MTTEILKFSLFIWGGLNFRDTQMQTPKTQTPGNKKRKKDLKLDSILLSKMFYAHAMFIGGNSQKESLSSPVYRCCVRWITLGTRGFSCAVSGVGYVSIVNKARTTREKPLVPRLPVDAKLTSI